MAATETDDLYQALIRDHFRRPRNRGPLEEPAVCGRAHNPFCGDTVQMWALVEGGRLVRIAFDGRGCAISQAAASMLTTVASGLDAAAVRSLRETFVSALTPGGPPLPGKLGDLRALAGVKRFPNRVRCATLPFEALESALEEGAARR